MLKKIIKDFNLMESSILAAFRYGSTVYGTNHEKSDQDFVLIFKDKQIQDGFGITCGDLSLHMYQKSSFQDLIDRYKIFAMECVYLPKEHVLKNEGILPVQKINLEKLRCAISEKASHSFVKAKKKLSIAKDKNIYIGKKSLFHSLRIIDFGKQIAEHKKIIDYSSANQFYYDIMNNPAEDWQHYHDKYKSIYNAMMTDFRKTAPK